jgi:hypothetical protein
MLENLLFELFSAVADIATKFKALLVTGLKSLNAVGNIVKKYLPALPTVLKKIIVSNQTKLYSLSNFYVLPSTALENFQPCRQQRLTFFTTVADGV